MRARRIADPEGERLRVNTYRLANDAKVKARKKVSYDLADPIVRKEKGRAYYEANKEALAVRQRAYAVKNAVTVAAGHAAYYRQNKARLIAHGAAYNKTNPDVRKRAQSNYSEKNRVSISAKGAAYRRANPEKNFERGRKWRLANNALVNSYGIQRRGMRLKRTLLHDAELLGLVVREGYDVALLREAATGIKWELDHTVPLQSKLVSGLHNEHNLQVITRFENRSKSNRHWPDMP
jgi:hypothetical protein